MGAGGTGTSTVAMAIAQAAGADPTNAGLVALVDASLDASQALLHHTGDVLPGLQEMVELHRTGRPDPATVRAGLWSFPDRGYDLLLGLRRHRDWTACAPGGGRHGGIAPPGLRDRRGRHRRRISRARPRRARSTSRSATRAPALLVAGADVVVVTGADGPAGVHRLVRTLADLVAHDVDPARILPVVVRAPRAPHRRAELARTVALLLGELSPERHGQPAHRAAAPRPRRAAPRRGPTPPGVLHTDRGRGRCGRRALRTVIAGRVDEPVPIRPGSLGMGGTR